MNLLRRYEFLTNSFAQGAAIPFGRSLCYKFAIGGFYAAFAYTGLCDESDPFCSPGAIKGMLLRHLRWWATHSDNIFWSDGTLNIGYLYPNMYMSEHYNSPQSPYWAVKSLIAIALAEDDPFWTSETAAHPLEEKHSNSVNALDVKPARQIICNHSEGNHHFMLSSGQFCVWSMKGTEAKYAKFAYSSAFAFSVPTGPSLTQIAPDSTLALSRDDGETWAVRWKTVGDTKFVSVPIHREGSPETANALVSQWKPWKYEGVEVESTLITPSSRWPDWHVRLHHIKCADGSALKRLTAVEGGFAINGEKVADGRMITINQTASNELLSKVQASEVAAQSNNSSLVLSSAGASGVLDLSNTSASKFEVSGEVLTPDPNTNLVARRTLIPTIKHNGSLEVGASVILATAVFAISFKNTALSLEEVQQRWSRQPSIGYNATSGWSLS